MLTYLRYLQEFSSKKFFRKELRSMEDRDVSEQIALGVPAKKTGDGLFDQRLFGENKGMDSGFDRKFKLFFKSRFIC